MSRKKNQNQAELQIVGQPELAAKKIEVAPIKPDITFESWFMQTGLKVELKKVLMKHFKARGFLDSKEFDKGLSDFGI
jgi:hypothetical protein